MVDLTADVVYISSLWSVLRKNELTSAVEFDKIPLSVLYFTRRITYFLPVKCTPQVRVIFN